MEKNKLKPFNAVIQKCPDCGKLDVYLNDGHTCDSEYENERQVSQEQYWK